MRKFILFSLLLVSNCLYGATYNKQITPATVDEIQDSTIKAEVISVLNGTDIHLTRYKTRRNKNLISSTHNNSNWMFHVELATQAGDPDNMTNNSVTINHQQDEPLLTAIRYYHVKYMLEFGASSLNTINKNTLSVFIGQVVTIKTEAYISKDYYRKYLCINLKSKDNQVSLVFIINNSYLYQCIYSKQ